MSSADALSRLVSDGGTDVREGYAEVGELRLPYVEAGDAPLVVLLHGFPESGMAGGCSLDRLPRLALLLRTRRRPPG